MIKIIYDIDTEFIMNALSADSFDKFQEAYKYDIKLGKMNYLIYQKCFMGVIESLHTASFHFFKEPSERMEAWYFLYYAFYNFLNNKQIRNPIIILRMPKLTNFDLAPELHELKNHDTRPFQRV